MYCYIVSKLGSNLHRYVVSVHKTEKGAVKSVLSDSYDDDIEQFMWDNKEGYEGTEGIDEKVLDETLDMLIRDYHNNRNQWDEPTEGGFSIWQDEQGKGYRIDKFLIEG